MVNANGKYNTRTKNGRERMDECRNRRKFFYKMEDRLEADHEMKQFITEEDENDDEKSSHIKHN